MENVTKVTVGNKTRAQMIKIAQTIRQLQDTFRVMVDTYREAAGLDESYVLSEGYEYFEKET